MASQPLKRVRRSVFGIRGGELTLTVVAEGHLGLAETNGVLAGAHAIELFELGLLHILKLR